MNVCYDDLRSKSNILAVAKESQQPGRRAVLFDKTETGYVSAFLKDNGISSGVEVLRTPFAQDLIETVASWGANQQASTREWIQVLAEDDTFLGLDEPIFLPSADTVMLLCPILFLYSDRLVLENQVECEKGVSVYDLENILPKLRAYADSSWHALVRLDVFNAYSRWIVQVPVRLWTISNAGVWFALSLGSVGKLNSFSFLKDCRKWSSKSESNKLIDDHLKASIGLENGSLHIENLHLLGVLAAMHDLRRVVETDRVECCINHIHDLLIPKPDRKHLLKMLVSSRACEKFFLYAKRRMLKNRMARHTRQNALEKVRQMNTELSTAICDNILKSLDIKSNLIDFMMVKIKRSVGRDNHVQ
jgi:hypothetical protein